MNRLTKKIEGQEKYLWDSSLIYSYKGTTLVPVINKLGELEDVLEKYNIDSVEELDKMLNGCRNDNDKIIEEIALNYWDISEERNCPLEVVIEAINENKIYVKFYEQLQCWSPIKIDLKEKLIWYSEQPDGHFALRQPLSNYGKSWFLPKDIEENRNV